MSDEQMPPHFQAIRRQIAKLQREDSAAWEEISATLEDLQVTFEQMQTSLEAAEVVEEELLEHYHHYHKLFELSPIASIVTDANGLIVEVNQASVKLLNVPYIYLVGKPLAVFVAKSDRAAFRTRLNRLAQSIGVQVWQMSLCPCNGEPVMAELHVALVRNHNKLIENLQIAVYNLSQVQQATTQGTQQQTQAEIRAAAEIPLSRLPRSLDGLRVLVVDDEADNREFIVALLEAHGIGVRAVASTAAALEELEQFRPNVLLSDIRMPGEDGYSLIRQIRTVEAQQGGHLPAAAITAYLEEDREKSLQAGFEKHLSKLAQPSEWLEMVAQLAEQSSSRGQGL